VSLEPTGSTKTLELVTTRHTLSFSVRGGARIGMQVTVQGQGALDRLGAKAKLAPPPKAKRRNP
jgi:ribosomal protein L5